MKFTDLFVRRPVLALVISTLILMLGVIALLQLPIRQYPVISTLILMLGVIAILQLPIRQYPMLESSTITVTTNYPGASAELMQGFVTQPIAQAVSSVEGIDYLTSSSVQGSSTVTVRMELNRDSTQALTEVMAKVNQVRYKLADRASRIVGGRHRLPHLVVGAGQQHGHRAHGAEPRFHAGADGSDGQGQPGALQAARRRF